ncbi:MAG: polysaccharide deacetylase family protein [Clostridia bacterium]|nr:polysaccharide deacetylase family protein [Clostridia bacterium]
MKFKENLKNKPVFIGLCSMMIFIITFSFCVSKQFDNKIKNVSASVKEEFMSLSNKKIGWGIKRANNHFQPDVGSENKRIMDKYNGFCLGSNDKKYLYLTFDAGYEAGYTEKILEILKQNDVKATFFITGHYLNTQPDLIKKMIENGNTVGNHTVNHKSIPDIDLDTLKNEVMKLHTAVYEKFGYEMKYFRPPKGEFSERTISFTNSLGYTSVMWSLAYDDWDENKQGREEYGKAKVLENLHNGAIILLHSTSKDNSNILDFIIKEAKKEGYEFRSLDEFER